MIRISKTSRLTTDEIIRRASIFFGEGGEGLEQTSLQNCCVSCAGRGRHDVVAHFLDGHGWAGPR